MCVRVWVWMTVNEGEEGEDGFEGVAAFRGTHPAEDAAAVDESTV